MKTDTLNQIRALVEAKGFALTPFLFKDALEVEFDVENDFTITPDIYLFDVKQHRYDIEEQIGTSYKILSLSPDTLLLPYAKMASKTVPLRVKSVIDYAIGYDLKGSITLSTDSIKIVGPAALIDTTDVLFTEELQLTEIRDDFNETIAVNKKELTNAEVFPQQVQVKGKVGRFTEGTLQVPVIITNKPQNVEINFFPKTVTVTFYVDLEQFNTISASDFIVECTYMDTDNNSNFLVPKITKQPDFLKWAKIKENRIDFIRL